MLGAAAVVAGLALPTGAQASLIELGGTSGPDAGTTLNYTGDKGERNNLTVRYVWLKTCRDGKQTLRDCPRVSIVDTGAKRYRYSKSSEGQCDRRGKRELLCETDAVYVALGDGDDRVRFAEKGTTPPPPVTDPLDYRPPRTSYDDEGSPDPSFIDTGTGDDTIVVPTGEAIAPGPGKDRVVAADSEIYLEPDGATDRITGGARTMLSFGSSPEPLTVDLAAGRAQWPGETDVITGVHLVYGTDGADTILGSPGVDGLFGSGGADTIDGRAGSDLIATGSKSALDGMVTAITPDGPAHLAGGAGDDVIDARRTASFTGPISADCGDGSDRVVSEPDVTLGRDCEKAMYRFVGEETEFEDAVDTLLTGVTIPIAPIARGADGAPTYDIPCPAKDENPKSSCKGKVTLERTGASGATEILGEGSFSIAAGKRIPVTVTLTPEGQAAVASGAPLRVHVNAGQTDFGWQQPLTP